MIDPSKYMISGTNRPTWTLEVVRLDYGLRLTNEGGTRVER